MESYTQSQWAGWAYPGATDPLSSYSQLPNYPTYLADSMDAAYQSHQQHLVHHQHMSRTTESKPRLSKEEVEVLEAEFQKNHKPNSNTKKALAESMRVENARINNWFQNRRAREKKENNIRKYEAKQKLERQKAGPDAGLHDDEQDLVASSAPFPDPRRPARSQTQASDSSSDLPDESETTSQYDGSNGLASPALPVKHEVMEFEDAESEPYENDNQHMGNFFALSGANLNVQTAHTSVQSPDEYLSADGTDGAESEYFFGQQYQHFLRQNDVKRLSPSHAVHLGSQAFLSAPMQQQHMAYEVDSDDQLKSPQTTDIASRRNRRPAPLSINGARSYASGIPKTAADLGRRAEFGSSMRRVSSATGSGRVSKPVSMPRSPLYDQKADPLFHLNRSPNMSGPRGTIAPPTPNTPLVANAQQSVGAGVLSPTFLLDEKSDLVAHDPTLRTPPTTPGLMDNLFHLNMMNGMNSDDDGLATPSLGGFSSDFDVPSMSTAVPGYIANPNDAPSQPETPLYAGHMGPTYFGFQGGNPEYNWSDASNSAKSSPGEHNVHFMNMTPSHFHGE